jgi:hypothetical protein
MKLRPHIRWFASTVNKEQFFKRITVSFSPTIFQVRGFSLDGTTRLAEAIWHNVLNSQLFFCGQESPLFFSLVSRNQKKESALTLQRYYEIYEKPRPTTI